MEEEIIHPAIIHYEGPESMDDEITEEHFRDALRYMVMIFPPERDFPTVEAYENALLPYDLDYRHAQLNLGRYAFEVLRWDAEAMRECYRRYSEDPSFHKDGLPKNFVSIALDKAWIDMGRRMTT